MKKILALLVFLGAMMQLWAQPGINMARAEEADIKISRLVQEHPEPLVSRDLLAWLKTGKVVFAMNRIIPEMASSQEMTPKGPQVMLWYNQDYVLDTPEVSRASDKLALLRLALFHEATHLDDHFKGKLKLLPLVIPRNKVPANIAQITWDFEWNAVSAEWELAKQWNVRYLIPEIALATRQVDNPRTFLEGFYNLQMNGMGAHYDPSLKPQFRAIYEREKAKISILYK